MIETISGVNRANDNYNAELRSTWIASPPDTSLLVTAVPANTPTIVTVGWGTEQETVFEVTGKSGDSPSNYALTGVTRLKGANENLQSGTAVNCLNHEEFFNQYETKINEVITEINTALLTVDALDAVVMGGFTEVADAATMTFDLDSGANRKFKTTALGGARTFAFSNPIEGQPFIIRILQGATAYTVTWPSGITWQGTSAPDTATEIATNKVGTFGFICTNASTPTYDGFVVGIEE